MLTVPRSWADVTAAWLGQVLGRAVHDVRIVDLADGTNARARVTFRWADNAEESAVFIKREGRMLNRLALSALRARESEVALAVSGLDLPLEHPAFLGGAVDRRRLATVVVMDDVVRRGGRPNSLLRPLSVDQVARGLADLAALHRAYLSRPVPAFVAPWRIGPQWALLTWPGLLLARRRLRRLGGPHIGDLAPVERGFRAWARAVRTGSQTLLHGDPHPGNTYAIGAGTGERIGFYDWQLVRSGSWVHDVGYFVISSLTPADRRAHERDLLADYLDALGLHPGDAWDRYRRAPVYGLGAWLQTIAAGGFQETDASLAAIERFASAYSDHRAGD